MKILFLTQWYWPEPARLLVDMAHSLQEMGHEVTVLTGFPNYPYGKVYPGYRVRHWQKEVLEGVDVVRVPLYPAHGRSALKRVLNFVTFPLAASILGVWLCPRPDIIVGLQPITGAFAGWVMSRIWRVPFTFEIQDLWPETLEATGMVNSPRVLRWVGHYADWVYRKAAAIRVISQGFKNNLTAKGVPPEKIHVISNWVDTDFYRPVEPDPKQAEELGLAGRFNVMYGGVIGISQALDTVLDAAERLSDLPAVQFVLVGDGLEFPRLREAARERGITNIKFLGRYPDHAMSSLYALADVLLVHLRDDPLFRITVPHKTYSYIASGKPVLCAVGGDAADVVEATGAGLGCPPEDADAMAAAVRRLYCMSADERAAMGQNGRRAACERFDRKQVLRDIEKLITSAAQRV